MTRLSAALIACLVVAAPSAAADEGWVITRFASLIDIEPSGRFLAREAVDADFGNQPKHGIFRDIVYQQIYDQRRNREYPITLDVVEDNDEHLLPVESRAIGALWRFRIGDPNRTVSGKQTYRINYRVGRALNGFADHDELYWNVTGTWPARITSTTIAVRPPIGGIINAKCFEGVLNSKEECRASFTDKAAAFTAARTLLAGEQLTIVVFFRKGTFPEPQPLLLNRPRSNGDMFDTTPGIVATTAVLFVAIVGGIGTLWWRYGRDRRFVAMHYLANDSAEERVPLFASDPVVVEFTPPDTIRPGQMGVLLDETADTLDATATIIDLAVRGYLTIKEIPKSSFFGHTDWQLDQAKQPDANLLDYERILLNGLFEKGPSRKLSQLRNVFYKDLNRAKNALYTDAVTRGWFPRNPTVVRAWAGATAMMSVMLGVFGGIWIGQKWGLGLLGAPFLAGGLLLAATARAMPRRSAAGRELLRRSLGFARYIKTAETHSSAFAERAVIFTQYLPYAIVLKCVDKWARAFQDVDLHAATAGFYAGAGSTFNAASFSSSMTGFSSSVSTAISSAPGGSGGSGGGGSSGGGGGGGGGGSW
ncbi:MAG TPA: DUF2207 domain-containing protein [Vicinamibacterales bacterium]|nr:DUF2207 domain-containing protein [Vicinamibacterales bacterium]